MRTRFLAWVAVPAMVAGTLVLLLAPSTPPIEELAAVPAGRLATLAQATGDDRGAARATGRSGAPKPRLRSLRPVSAGALRPARPDRLKIPSTGVEVGLEPVRADGDEVEVPPVDRAGWLSGGPRPGEPGHAVVIGHRDGLEGPAVFTDVSAIEPGDPVLVTDRRGARHRYQVVGTTQVHKAEFPAEAVYGRSRRPVLVLVTCGGEYDAASGYEDSVLVFARAA